MEELQKRVISLFRDEHNAWVKAIKEAEEQKTGIDLNLGGGFADRINDLMQSFRDYSKRLNPKKKGLF